MIEEAQNYQALQENEAKSQTLSAPNIYKGCIFEASRVGRISRLFPDFGQK